MKYKDYYLLLEVKRNATGEEIKKAYHHLAKMYHPDSSKGDKEAEEKIREVNEAYEVLGNSMKKKKYDALINRFNFMAGFDFDPAKFGAKKKQEIEPDSEGAFSDFFDLFFGSNAIDFEGGTFENSFTTKEEELLFKKGNDIEVDFETTLEEAFYGLQTKLSIKGAGSQKKEYDIVIPPGARNGEKIKLIGKGHPGTIGAPPGDLYVTVKIKKHDRFEIKGNELLTEIPITPWEAVLGSRAVIDTIDGKLSIKIPGGIQAGSKLRIHGKGYVSGAERGDLLCKIKIMIPDKPTEKEIELFKALSDVSTFSPR